MALGLSLVLDYLRSRLQGVVGNLLGDALMPVVTRQVLTRSARSPSATRASVAGRGQLRGLFSAQALLALFDAPWALVYIGVIWLAHPALGAAAALAALLMLGLAVLNDRLTRRDIEVLQRARLGRAALDRSIDAPMPRWRRRWAWATRCWRAGSRMNASMLELQRPTAQRSVALAALTRTLRQAVQVGMLALGAYLVITQRATPGVMVATTILLGRALAPVEQIVGSWSMLVEGRAALRRLRALLEDAGARPETMALPAAQARSRRRALHSARAG